MSKPPYMGEVFPGAFSYLYVFKCGEFFKIGIAQNPRSRLAVFGTYNPFDVEVVLARRVAGKHAIAAENLAHNLLGAYHHRGEWYAAPEFAVRQAVGNAIRAARREEEKERDAREKAVNEQIDRLKIALLPRGSA